MTPEEGMERPEESVDWSEVEVARLTAERDKFKIDALRLSAECVGLKAAVVAHEIVEDVLRATNQVQVARLRGELNRARAIAIRLEQELAASGRGQL